MEFIEMFHLGLPPQIDFCAFPCYTCLVGVGTDYRQQKKRKALHITLAPSEKLVYSSLGLHSKSLWELLECTSLSPAELSGCLLSLEQKGLAREVERNYYVKV